MGEKSKGYLLLIGGAEDKSEESDILRKVVSLSGERGACLTILTVATKEPEKVGETYVKLFSRMGVKDVTAII